MKVLVTLSILQTALILFLIVAGNRGESGLDRVAERDGGEAASVESLSGAQSPSQRDADDARLRQIIREELQSSLTADAQEARRQEESAAAIAAEDPRASEYRRDVVERQIEYYRSLGTISDSEMEALQVEIAKLDSSGRNQMMSKLVRAMNAGEIHGKLL